MCDAPHHRGATGEPPTSRRQRLNSHRPAALPRRPIRSVSVPHINDGLPIDWTPQLIALDIDDTLTVHLGEMKPRVIDAIAAVREKGVEVVLATGRAFDTTTPVARDAGLNGHVVCS
ncbi:MAG: HAD hydrolase family protein, partial [Candidatus Nanopelagicales bacterium]|nr:HAD hydrolase family protein [Candidatus Nanopelagicales bacterium]